MGGRESGPLVPSPLAQRTRFGRLPGRGGAGGGRPLPGGGAGASGVGGGAGGRAGAGVSLPPSLSPVKSRGAAGLSPVSSSCSLGRAAVTVHRRRRGLYRRVRPPARPPVWPPPPPAPASPTTTSFSRSSASTAHPPHAAAPHPSPGTRALCGFSPRPPGPAPAAAAPPRPAPPPAFPACCLGAPRPWVPCPAAPSAPCSSCRAAAPGAAAAAAAAGTAAPGLLPGAFQPRPSRTLQTLPSPRPRLPAAPSLYSAPGPQFPRTWFSGPSPALQLQPRCGARVWGDV